MSAGINVNSWDSEASRNTPLHWAACYGNKDTIQYLIGKLSIYLKKISFIRMMLLFNIYLEKGANVNAENGCGATPLHEAVNRCDIDICQVLLSAGANPLIGASKGYVSLFFYLCNSIIK